MVRKIKNGKKLWGTDTDSLSGAEMLYGVETPEDVKEKYETQNLNETKNIKPSI